MSEKLLEKSEMCSETYATEMLKERVAPPKLSSNIGERIRAAARKLGWSYSRTKDLWYNNGQYKLKAKELLDLETKTGVRYTGIEDGKEEVREIDDLITRADALLGYKDENLTRTLIDAFRKVARAAYRAGVERRERRLRRKAERGRT